MNQTILYKVLAKGQDPPPRGSPSVPISSHKIVSQKILFSCGAARDPHSFYEQFRRKLNEIDTFCNEKSF
jgi:hypothetical protein